MLTRRNFLKLVATLFGSAFATACARALAIPTADSPATSTATVAASPTVTSTATRTATATATATPTATTTVVPPTLSPTPTATPRPADFVTVRGDQFFYRGARFPINGFNYYPRMHPWKTFNLGEWEPDVTEKEMKIAASLGANNVRMFVDFNYSLVGSIIQAPFDVNALVPNQNYLANVREFLEIAARLNLKVQFTLFDSMSWNLYQPENFWIVETYLRTLIPMFANDPRIMCWDLQNEPDRAIRTIGANSVIPFFQRVSKLIRQLDPRQLQTIGWIDRARAQYFPDLDPYLDFWCFHFYDKAANLPDLVKFYKTKTTKPVLLQEFGLPTGPASDNSNTEADQAAHYASVLTTLDENQMCGSVFWCLNDYPIGLAGNPPVQIDHPENHFGVLRLDYSEKPVTRVLRSFWLR